MAEYLVDFNAQAAAGRAGYSTKDTAAGVRIMSSPAVTDEIRRRCLDVQARLEMNGDDIRRAFARIATDPRSEAQGGPGYEPRIKALRELGKLLGLYTQKLHVTGTLTLEALLLAADMKAVSGSLGTTKPSNDAALPQEQQSFQH